MDFDTDNQNLIGIFTTDAGFIVQVWDGVLEQLTGISAARARGRSILETIPDLERRGLLARFERVLEEGTVEILAPAFHRFLIFCAPRFDSKHFAEMRQRVTIAPLKEAEKICGLIVTIEDVTERMEREIGLAEQLKDSDEAVRLGAAKAISQEAENLGEETAAPIIDALGDKNWRVRRQLIESLSRRAAPEAIAALLHAMRERHFDFGVLNSALQVLQATSVNTTETLIDFLRGADADLRMQAALTLGEQKDLQAIPALLETLNDENVNVRYHAVEALGKLRAGEAVEPLLKIAESGDFFLSFAALDALRQIADESAAARILPLLNDELLREAAVETLGAVGNPDVVSSIVNSLNEDKVSALAAAHALGALFERFAGDSSKGAKIIARSRKTINAAGKANLLDALNKTDESELVALIRLSGWFDDEKLSEKLAQLLENENVREAAVKALVEHGSSAVDLLIERLAEDDFEESCAAAARALGQIGDARAFDPLVELLRSENAGSRLAAFEALKSLADPETVGRLCDLLNDSNSNVRESAIRVIGYFGAKGCENAILECCDDPDERIRRAAIEQLPNLSDARAVEALIENLKNGSSRIRETAAKALAQVKSRAAISALREALADADPWTRYFAVRALGTLGDEASREKLSEIAETDEAEQVRAAAQEVLNELKK
jgi:HEAT repeat protein